MTKNLIESAKGVSFSMNGENKIKYVEKTKFSDEYSDSLVVKNFRFETVNSLY